MRKKIKQQRLVEYEAGRTILTETREFLLEVGAMQPKVILKQRIADLLEPPER